MEGTVEYGTLRYEIAEVVDPQVPVVVKIARSVLQQLRGVLRSPRHARIARLILSTLGTPVSTMAR